MRGELRVTDARELLLSTTVMDLVPHQQCAHQYHDGPVRERLQDQLAQLHTQAHSWMSPSKPLQIDARYATGTILSEG